MSLDLINITTREVLELLKSEYYNQTGKTIQIGSDEFASSAVQSYAWSILFNRINVATQNRFIDTASGEFLDAIASNYGIAKRPDGYRATARFNVTCFNSALITVPEGAIVVSDDSGNRFTNIYEFKLKANSDSILLYADEPGAKYNGIPLGEIHTVIDGDHFITTVSNITQTAGGTDGFPYTESGDDDYRVWLKTEIQSFAGAGTALAYEARAKNADARVKDVYVLRQDDEGYIKGKVQIYILTDSTTDLNEQVKEIVQHACSDEKFRPIGDYVVTSYSPKKGLLINNPVQVTYPRKFQALMIQRNNRIILEYRDYLAQKINRPFIWEEFCSLFTKKDDDGVYAVDAKPLNITDDSFERPVFPYIGGHLGLANMRILSNILL